MLCISFAAYAHEIPQERSDCSIEIIVRYDGENVSGGTLTAVKVGNVDEENGDYFFSQVITGKRLDDVASAGAAGVQETFYLENKDHDGFYTQTKSVENGKAVFTDLPTGLYLILQEKAAPGYRKMGAFLIGVPSMVDGVYQYDVIATIKTEIERETEPTTPPPTKPDDPDLPQTGQLNWPVPVMAVAGIAMFTIGWILYSGKKETYEK